MEESGSASKNWTAISNSEPIIMEFIEFFSHHDKAHNAFTTRTIEKIPFDSNSIQFYCQLDYKISAWQNHLSNLNEKFEDMLSAAIRLAS